MGTQVLFITFLLCCCGYAAIAGGRSGKAGAVLFIGAGIATYPASFMTQDWGQPKAGLLFVDLALLVGLILLALRSRHHWPIWSAGLHLNTVVAHLARLIVPEARNIVYEATVAAWSLPVLLAMAVGIWLDRRGGFAPAKRGLDD